ncbi:MAG: DUF1937 family protein [Litorimonas sp.]
MTAGLVHSKINWTGLVSRYGGAGGLIDLDASILDVAKRLEGRQVYMSVPFSKQVVEPRSGRFEVWRGDAVAQEAARWSAMLAVNRVSCVAPVVLSSGMLGADMGGEIDPLNGDFWRGFCAPILSASSAVVVPPITGAMESAGVFYEAAYALRRNTCVMVMRGGV